MTAIKTYRYYIGIDPGVNTGFCVWNKKEKFIRLLCSLPIHLAMAEVKSWHETTENNSVFVYVEDARQVRFGTDPHKAQGAGSVKRDAKIWEDFLKYENIDFEMVRPKKAFTKMPSDKFARLTGYNLTTNQHARDAAMLVFGR